MWVKQSVYIALEKQVSAQSATIEWMRNQINRLERRNALLEGKIGIPPVDVPQIERIDGVMAAPPVPTRPHREPEAPTPQDILAGNVNFEDMGDERAKAEGVDWDPATGQLSYR